MERNSEAYHAEKGNVTKGLGRKFSWSQFVNITPAQAEELPEPDQIPCMCNDGGDDEE